MASTCKTAQFNAQHVQGLQASTRTSLILQWQGLVNICYANINTHTCTVPLKITMKFLTTRSLHQCQKFLSVTNLQLVIQGNHENKYFIKSGPTSRRPLELRMREGQSLSSIKMKLIKTAKSIIITKALCLLI